MFWTVLRFELAYHRRRPATYLYFAVLFLIAFFALSSESVQLSGAGREMRNSPYALAVTLTLLTAFGTVITTALVGTAILRDVQVKSHELLFTTRLTRTGYLAGRFVGAFLVMVVVYAALPLGALVGTLMPWVDHDKMQAFRLMSYVQPFVVFIVPNILFVSALFFAVGAFTRNVFAVYVQGIALFALWAISQQALSDVDRLQLASLLDPFAVSTVSLATRYWTVAERNTRLVALAGPVLWNRLLWVGLAAGLFGLALSLVRLEAASRTLTLRGWRRRSTTSELPSATATLGSGASWPTVALRFDARARVQQLMGLTRFFFASFVREPVYLALAVICLVNVGLLAWNADTSYGTPIWPVTAEMFDLIIGGSSLFIIILATVYAGEMVWRERQLKIDGTVDALPVPTAIVLIGKLLAVLGVLTVLSLVSLLATLAVQTIKGYHHYELTLYAKAILGILLPLTINITILALLIHTVINNKYVGHVLMVVVYLLFAVVGAWGFDRVLYQYTSPPAYVYSDMNGFGHYVPSLSWVLGFHTAVALGLLVIAYLLWVRGADDRWRARWAAARDRWSGTGTRVAGGATALAALATGGVVFYNTAVLNPYLSDKRVEGEQAAYEGDYRRFKDLAEPRIVGVRLRVDLVPERRAFSAQGVYRLVNKHARPLDTLYVGVPNVLFKQGAGDSARAAYGYRVDSLVWNRPTRVLIADTARGVYVYELVTPLQPRDSMTLAFGTHFAAHGFPNAHPNDDIVANGTFFATDYFPSLSYEDGVELGGDDVRKRHGLKPKPRVPSIHDEAARANSALSRDADWIDFDATVSTAPDQIAIAPGYLQREWVENGRRLFAYHMDTQILNFYSIQSARYKVRRDEYKGVTIEVYYQPGHEYDLDRMIDATKRGLDYYTASFGPYQFRQFRIIEFPRYQTFAESFANTVPFSEGIGFIARVRDRDDDLDMPLFVTAHELAHQWWGHQVIPANTQGASMLTESLAEYSALAVMERQYGRSRAQKFLRYEMDRYLRGRSTERKQEMPLMLVEGQQYIHYNKGSLAFYALRDYIGEDSLNAALRRFVRDKGFQSPPYTNTLEFLKYIRVVTPDSLQYVIHDLFETITLYDNRATAATATRKPDGTYAVHLTFEARKLRADSLGNQTEVPIGDYIDVGVFGPREPGNALGKPLAVRKVHVTQSPMSVDFVVAERPVKAGIDPYNKLVDRAPEDNVRAVEISQ